MFRFEEKASSLKGPPPKSSDTAAETERAEEAEANWMVLALSGQRRSDSPPAVITETPRALARHQTLDAEVRRPAEALLGTDFSRVRARADDDAGRRARAEGAHAFTMGDEIYFAEGRYRPDHPLGRALIWHELAHVAQARRALADGETSGHREHSHPSSSGQSFSGAPRLRRCKESPGPTQTTAVGDAGTMPGGAGTSDAGTAPSARTVVFPKTGADARKLAAGMLEEDQLLKDARDLIRVSLNEVKEITDVSKQGQQAKFHLTKTTPTIEAKLTSAHKDKAAITRVKSKWTWLLNNPNNKDWSSERDKLFDGPDLKGSIQGFKETFDIAKVLKSPTSLHSFLKDWLTWTPAAAFDLVLKVANADIPAAFLYSAASMEGLQDLVRTAVGDKAGQSPSEADLAKFDASKTVKPAALGLIDYFKDDPERKAFAKSGFAPAGYKAGEKKPFPNLEAALVALRSDLAWRRSIVLKNAQDLFGATPSNEEGVYFTYLYYYKGNTGGRKLLADQAAGSTKPSFADIITKTADQDSQTRNAFKVYMMYKTLVAATLLPGY